MKNIWDVFMGYRIDSSFTLFYLPLKVYLFHFLILFLSGCFLFNHFNIPFAGKKVEKLETCGRVDPPAYVAWLGELWAVGSGEPLSGVHCSNSKSILLKGSVYFNPPSAPNARCEPHLITVFGL